MVESLKIEMIRAVVMLFLTFAFPILAFYLGDALINSLDTKTSYCIDNFSSVSSCKALVYSSHYLYLGMAIGFSGIILALGLLIGMTLIKESD